jgi:hypothetical protein
MAYERKDGDFILFKNGRKSQDQHPDYSGDILINGETRFLDCWIKTGAKGDFLTGRVGKVKQPKQQDDGYSKPAPSNVPPQSSFEDEIPF